MALAGKSLSLSFSPATQEDEDTLVSYLPDADEDGELDPGELPDTLPGHLINLKARFSIGSETVANPEQELAMGSGLASEMGYWQPGCGWDTSENKPIAGEFRALALDLQGISGPAAEKLQTDLETTQAKLEDEEYSGLTKQQLVGDMLYSTILSYFALNDIQDRLSERLALSVGYRAPSYGIFKTSLQPQYWFGMPRDVKASGLTMDVDHMTSIRVDKNNDRDRWVALNRAQGARMSAMEHLVPEEMYTTEANSANGISAIKALKIASSEGQRIWTINKINMEYALPALNVSDAVEMDIRNSVYAGKEVTAHETAVNLAGKPCFGYMVVDPETGAGAYLIESGENGGVLEFSLIFALFVFAFFLSVMLITSSGWLILAGIVSFVWNVMNFVSWVDGLRSSETKADFSSNNFTAMGGLVMGLLASYLSGGAAAVLWFGDFMAYFLGMI